MAYKRSRKAAEVLFSAIILIAAIVVFEAFAPPLGQLMRAESGSPATRTRRLAPALKAAGNSPIVSKSDNVSDSTAQPISADFFGMTVQNIPAAPWPTTLGVPFSGFRTLGVQIKWSDIEPTCDGGSDPTNACYTWTNFDYWINLALSNGQDVLYVVYWTPTWASSNPSDTNCAHGFLSAGGCDPPNDLNADGTGTDQHFIDFLTALMQHTGAGKIKYWGLWNEPNILNEWTGTNAQLLRLAQDLRSTVLAADPNTLFLTPAYVGNTAGALGIYLAAGGGQYADIIAYHGYVVSGVCPSDCPIPENEGPLVAGVRRVMATYGQQNKPLFDIESSWGAMDGNPTIKDPDQQVAFTGRFYLMHLSEAVNRFYWFAWNSLNNGHLYSTKTQQIIPAGIAYEQIYNWTVGNTLTAPCSNVGTSWACSFTGPSSYVAEALWNSDPSFVCNSGVCPTQNVAVPTHYTQYRDLAGNTVGITNQTVPIGSKPILVEGSTPDISISKTTSNSNPAPGASLNYTITLSNNTANPISPVTVSDNLDPSLTLQSCSTTGSGSCQVSGNSVTVTYSSMATGETDTITLAVTISSTASAPIVNTATANWTNASGNAATNWSTMQVPLGTPQAKLSTTSLTFPNQVVNTTSSSQTVAVTSTGTGDLVIYNITLDGLNSLDFQVHASPLPITVPPHHIANIKVTFTPSGTGSRSAAFLISDNTSAGTGTVNLHGTGVLSSKTTLHSSANPSLVGQSLTFTANVSGSGTTPTGTVTFTDGSTTLASVALNGSGSAAYTTSTLSAGSHSIAASYGGDSNYGASKASLTESVQWATTTTLQSSLNPSTYGQSVVFTATVSSTSSSAASGSVTFDDGTNVLGTAELKASGVATLTTPPRKLAAGSQSITAVYGGSSSYAGSASSSLTQVVNAEPTTTTLSSSANPSTLGQTVTFTAVVATTVGTPKGTVVFQDGTTSIGTATLDSTGTAQFGTSSLAAGQHSIEALYQGSRNYAASTSATLTQTVQ